MGGIAYVAHDARTIKIKRVPINDWDILSRLGLGFGFGAGFILYA